MVKHVQMNSYCMGCVYHHARDKKVYFVRQYCWYYNKRKKLNAKLRKITRYAHGVEDRIVKMLSKKKKKEVL